MSAARRFPISPPPLATWATVGGGGGMKILPAATSRPALRLALGDSIIHGITSITRFAIIAL